MGKSKGFSLSIQSVSAYKWRCPICDHINLQLNDPEYIGSRYCDKSDNLLIEEAYDKVLQARKVLQVYVEDDALILDIEIGDVSGFYIKINYCPICGKKISE